MGERNFVTSAAATGGVRGEGSLPLGRKLKMLLKNKNLEALWTLVADLLLIMQTQ